MLPSWCLASRSGSHEDRCAVELRFVSNPANSRHPSLSIRGLRPCAWGIGARRAPAMLGEWVRRRLKHLLGVPVVLEVGWHVHGRIRFALRALPPFLALRLMRAIGNAWPTSRRILQRASSCLLGCMAVWGDDVRHYLLCPRVPEYCISRRLLGLRRRDRGYGGRLPALHSPSRAGRLLAVHPVPRC